MNIGKNDFRVVAPAMRHRQAVRALPSRSRTVPTAAMNIQSLYSYAFILEIARAFTICSILQ